MEIINSFFSNIKEKMTNPFFGTLILVLIFHHWELIYTLFNFNEDLTLDIKLTFIKTYISDNITFDNFLWDAFWALIFMFSGYFIIVLTRGIVLWMEYWLMPFITEKIINKKVVLKDTYDSVVKQRDNYYSQFEEIKITNRDFSTEIDRQKTQIIQQTNTISAKDEELNSKKIKLEKSLQNEDRKSNELSSVHRELYNKEEELKYKTYELDKFMSLFFDKKNQCFYSSLEKFPPEVINKFNNLKDENKLKTFIDSANHYETEDTLSYIIENELVKRDLLFKKGPHKDLTPVGKIIYHYRKIFLNN